MNKKKLIALVAAPVATFAFTVPAPAQAATGTMNLNEFLSICYSSGPGCANKDSQKEVGDKCNCTGDVVSTWTDADGYSRHRVSYNDSYETGGATVTYRLKNGFWGAMYGTYCDQYGCSTHP